MKIFFTAFAFLATSSAIELRSDPGELSFLPDHPGRDLALSATCANQTEMINMNANYTAAQQALNMAIRSALTNPLTLPNYCTITATTITCMIDYSSFQPQYDNVISACDAGMLLHSVLMEIDLTCTFSRTLSLW